MNYKGYWRYNNNKDLRCGENIVRKGDIIYVLIKKDDILYAMHKRENITIRCNNVMKSFVREYRRGHPPAKCGIGALNCELCDIWMKKRQCL